MNKTSIVRPAISLLIVLSAITGIAYPVAMTGIGKVLFPHQAAGSLIERNGVAVGSSLIGQSFSTPKYFWSRLSATSPQPYNGASSGGSNLGPTNPALLDAVKGRIDALKAADPDNKRPIPVDLVTASGSGLDPHISVAAARYQIDRVARERHVPVATVSQLVDRHTQAPLLGLLGEARVNVLELNLDLDRVAPH